jgi:hypothetical protein
MHFDGYTYVILRVLVSNISFYMHLADYTAVLLPQNVNKQMKNAYEWKVKS